MAVADVETAQEATLECAHRRSHIVKPSQVSQCQVLRHPAIKDRVAVGGQLAPIDEVAADGDMTGQLEFTVHLSADAGVPT